MDHLLPAHVVGELRQDRAIAACALYTKPPTLQTGSAGGFGDYFGRAQWRIRGSITESSGPPSTCDSVVFPFY